MTGRRLLIEADGGSRGNPGTAGYGAVVRDAVTREVLAELSEPIGRATNNGADYSGLVAGLRAAGKLAPGAPKCGAPPKVRRAENTGVKLLSGDHLCAHSLIGLFHLRADSPCASPRGWCRIVWP